MADKYWIKLYHEILDDPKMALLPDHLWRFTIELFLLAGKNGDDGSLPEPMHIAWMLRRSIEEITADLKALVETGIISVTESGYIVTKFASRQSASSSAERTQRYRDAKQKSQYYCNENETDLKRNVTQNQINRLTDIDTDTELIPASPEIPPEPKFIHQFLDILGMKFTRNEQADDLHELYEVYGPDLLLEVAVWAKDKSPRNLPHALSMIRSAVATWKIKDRKSKEKSFAERLAEA